MPIFWKKEDIYSGGIIIDIISPLDNTKFPSGMIIYEFLFTIHTRLFLPIVFEY